MKKKGQAHSAVGGVALGIMWSVLITMAGALILGKLVDMELIRMESLGYFAMLVIGISSWTAAAGAIISSGSNPYASAVMGGGGYFAVMLAVNALFFGGEYPGFWSGLIVAALCAGLAAFTAGKGRVRSARRHYKIPKG